MKKRTLRIVFLSALCAGSAFQLASCIADTVFQVAGVALLDLFLSPLVGDECTLFNPAGCQNPA